MQGIYTHIPETNHVPREYTVAAILLLLFMVHLSLIPVLALLYFCISTFRSTCALPNMAVFCSSLTSWYYYYYSKGYSEQPHIGKYETKSKSNVFLQFVSTHFLFTNHHTTNKCTNCMSFIFKSLF